MVSLFTDEGAEITDEGGGVFDAFDGVDDLDLEFFEGDRKSLLFREKFVHFGSAVSLELDDSVVDGDSVVDQGSDVLGFEIGLGLFELTDEGSDVIDAFDKVGFN